MREVHPRLLVLGWIALAIAATLTFWPGLLPRPTGGADATARVPPAESNGVSMRWLTGHPEMGDHYRVELCYSLPDRRDWLLTYPRLSTTPLLKLGGQEMLPVEEGTLYWLTDAGGEVTQRCQYLEFFGQPLAGETTLTLRIRSLGAPKADQPDACQEVRDMQGQRGLELSMTCTQREGFPGTLTERLPLLALRNDPTLSRPLYAVERDFVDGEWSFTFPVLPQ